MKNNEHLECKKNFQLIKKDSFLKNKNKDVKDVKEIITPRSSVQETQIGPENPEDKGEDEYELMTEYGEETATDTVKKWIEVVTEEEGLKYTIKEWKNDLMGHQNQKVMEIIFSENKEFGEWQKVSPPIQKLHSAKRTKDVIYKEFTKEDLYLTQRKVTRVYDKEPLTNNKKNIKEVYWWISSKGDKKLEEPFCKHEKNDLYRNDVEDISCFGCTESETKLKGNIKRIESEKVNIDEICPELETFARHKATNRDSDAQKNIKNSKKLPSVLTQGNIWLQDIDNEGSKYLDKKINNIEQIINVLRNVNFRGKKLSVNKCEHCGKFRKENQRQINDFRRRYKFTDIDLIRKYIDEPFIKKNKTKNSRKHKKKQMHNKRLCSSKNFREWLKKVRETQKKKSIKIVKRIVPNELREKIMKLSYGITPLSARKIEQKEWNLLVQKRLKRTPAWKYLSTKVEEICDTGRSKMVNKEMEKQAKLWEEREIVEKFWKKKVDCYLKSKS